MDLISLASMQAPGAFSANLDEARTEASSSIARLSSGNAIVRAGDDVANLSVSTSLQTRITTIRSSLINTLQATSLLQVADDGLREIQNVLFRMNGLATQAGGGGLTDNDRSFIDLEFQQLKDEINRISDGTNFNGVNVLKLDETVLPNAVATEDGIAPKASASIDFSSIPGNNRTFRIQGVVFRFVSGVPATPLQVQRGSTVEETVTNLLATIEAYPAADPTNGLRLTEATYTRTGPSSFTITSKTAGELSELYTIDYQQSTSRLNFTISGAQVAADNASGSFILGEADGKGLGAGSVSAVGKTSGGLVATQMQEAAKIEMLFSLQPTDGERIAVDNGFNGGNIFVFRDNASASNNLEIQIGDTIEETIRNAAETLSAFSDSEPQLFSYVTRQLDYAQEDKKLVITYKGVGNPTDFNENDGQVNAFSAAITLPSALTVDFLDNGVNSGFNTQGVINKDFVGSISGFEGEYVSSDRMSMSLVVGESTYQATFDTDFTTHQTVRFDSDEGGYFDIIFDAALNTVSDTSDAILFANRVEQAMNGLTFYQTRELADLDGDALLDDTTLEIRLDDYTEPIVFESLSVKGYNEDKSANDATARIEMTFNGETYQSVTPMGIEIAAYQKIVLESTTNPERQIIFTNNEEAIAIRTEQEANLLEVALLKRFPAYEDISNNDAVSFQIDEDNNDQLTYIIETTSTDTLFQNATSLAVDGADAALDAFAAVQEALDIVIARRAYVGSLQSRSSYIYASLESSVISHEAARGVIADTDISTEATEFARSIIKVQAAIAVGAQANVLRSTVLDIIESL